jgi:hypothetical protein
MRKFIAITLIIIGSLALMVYKSAYQAAARRHFSKSSIDRIHGINHFQFKPEPMVMNISCALLIGAGLIMLISPKLRKGDKWIGKSVNALQDGLGLPTFQIGLQGNELVNVYKEYRKDLSRPAETVRLHHADGTQEDIFEPKIDVYEYRVIRVGSDGKIAEVRELLSTNNIISPEGIFTWEDIISRIEDQA